MIFIIRDCKTKLIQYILFFQKLQKRSPADNDLLFKFKNLFVLADSRFLQLIMIKILKLKKTTYLSFYSYLIVI